jgi:3',5'-cyclic AMP phosphodiesterase CpdA
LKEWQQFFAMPPLRFSATCPCCRRWATTTIRELFRQLLCPPPEWAGRIPGDHLLLRLRELPCHRPGQQRSLGVPGTGDYDQIASWLQRDLARSQQPWKFVVCHHPPYQVVADWRGEHLQANWVPLFEEGGADLVFTGHQHVYMRTRPLREGRVQGPRGRALSMSWVMPGTSTTEPRPGTRIISLPKLWPGVSNYQVVQRSREIPSP